MVFEKRFKEIRKEAGISQEKVAERLNVSRQAVAKWEAGLTVPDVDNLIQISGLFQVSLDYLVKETTYRQIEGVLKNDNSEIIDFIVEAKKGTYASAANFDATLVDSSRMASKDLAYEKGDFKYLDTYVGSSRFSGSEVVYHKKKPVWSMNYNGRLLSGQLGDFLTKMLSFVSAELPYRGPDFYREGRYSYVNLVSGEFDWFQGSERIYYENELIYELVYHGGAVK